MTDPWDALRQAYAEGQTTMVRADTLYDRCVEFEDGTLWFPDGRPEAQATRVGPAAMFGLTLMTGTVSLVLFVDGHPWAVASLLGPALCLAGLVLLLGRQLRAEAAAEARLERGVVLRPDALVLRDPPHDVRVKRDSIRGFAVRLAHRGGDKAQPWVHVLIHADAPEVPLSLTERFLPMLEAWFER